MPTTVHVGEGADRTACGSTTSLSEEDVEGGGEQRRKRAQCGGRGTRWMSSSRPTDHTPPLPAAPPPPLPEPPASCLCASSLISSRICLACSTSHSRYSDAKEDSACWEQWEHASRLDDDDDEEEGGGEANDGVGATPPAAAAAPSELKGTTATLKRARADSPYTTQQATHEGGQRGMTVEDWHEPCSPHALASAASARCISSSRGEAEGRRPEPAASASPRCSCTTHSTTEEDKVRGKGQPWLR